MFHLAHTYPQENKPTLPQTIKRSLTQRTLTVYESDDLSITTRMAGAIGFNETCELCARFGGRSFYVPRIIIEHHVLFLLLGNKADILADEFGGQTIELPLLVKSERIRQEDLACRLVARNLTLAEIKASMGITDSKLMRIKRDNRGLIEVYKKQFMKHGHNK